MTNAVLGCRYTPECVQVTATSGSAAVLVKGITVHSALGLRRANQTVEDLAANMGDAAKDRWRLLKVLVLEEYSLLSSDVLGLMDKLGRRMKGIDLPFGGVRLIIFG